MNKTELKTYIAVLESVAKKTASIPILKGFRVENNTITATDLTTRVVLNYGTKNNGVVSKVGLERLVLDPESDLAPYSMGEINDFPDFIESEPTFTGPLSKGFYDMLMESVNYVSTDKTRPALERVWLQEGYVAATDGYKAIYHPANGIGCMFPVAFDKFALSLLKKVYKYGEWKWDVNENRVRFTNGTLTIEFTMVDAKFPDMNTLLARTTKFTHIVRFPLKTVLGLTDKDHSIIKVDWETGEITIGDVSYKAEHDFVPTGLTAYIGESAGNNFAGNFVTRRILMPMTNADTEKALILNLNYLKQMSKAEEVSIYANKGTMDFVQLAI